MKKWTKEKVINELKETANDFYAISYWENTPLRGAAQRLFGSWSEAVKSAGLLLKGSSKPLKKCIVDDCESSVRSSGKDYCEKHYMRVRRNGGIEALVDITKHENCLHCGELLDKPGKYCSVRCQVRGVRGNPLDVTCVVCGKNYVPNDKGIDKKVCSFTCKEERRRIWNRKNYKDKIKNSPLYRERMREYGQRRKAKKMAAHSEKLKREDIFVRDNWTCKLCGKKIEQNLKWPEPGFATIDHIIPLSKGGSHTIKNVQAAHLVCNLRKNDKILPEGEKIPYEISRR